MGIIQRITITDDYGTEWAERFWEVFDFNSVQTEGEGLGERGHGDLFQEGGIPLSTREDLQPLLEAILRGAAERLEQSVSVEWSETLGGYIIGWWDGKDVSTDTISDDGEGRGRFEFSTLVYSLGLTVVIGWEPGPALTRTQQLAANAEGGMFTPHRKSPHSVSFVDAPEREAEDVKITISAGWSSVDPLRKLITIDTEAETGLIRVMLNEATIFDGDPEH